MAVTNKVEVRPDDLKQLQNNVESLKNIWQSQFQALSTATQLAQSARSQYTQSYVQTAANNCLSLCSSLSAAQQKAAQELAVILSGLNTVITEYDVLEYRLSAM